jgi:hypothetical protein
MIGLAERNANLRGHERSKVNLRDLVFLCNFESHEKRCIEPGIVLFALPLVTMEVKS